MERSRTDTGRSWPFRMHITVRIAALVGLGDRLQPISQLDAGCRVRPGAPRRCRRPVEELVARQPRVSPYSSRCARNSFVGPGNSRRFSVRLGPRAPASTVVLGGQRGSGFGRPRPSGPWSGTVPATHRRVAEFTPQEARSHESGMSYRPGRRRSRRRHAAPTNASARSPTTFDDGVTLTSRPSIRSAAAYLASTSSNRLAQTEAMACWPQIDELPAGDLVGVHPPVGAGSPDSNGAVHLSQRLPVRLQVAHALRTARCRTQCARRPPRWPTSRLTGVAGHGAEAPSTASAPACQAAT
jgi:hypothetical protein